MTCFNFLPAKDTRGCLLLPLGRTSTICDNSERPDVFVVRAFVCVLSCRSFTLLVSPQMWRLIIFFVTYGGIIAKLGCSASVCDWSLLLSSVTHVNAELLRLGNRLHLSAFNRIASTIVFFKKKTGNTERSQI